MKLTRWKFKTDWKVISGTRRLQAGLMVIAPGDSEGGPTNKHSGDQWLLVLSGSGTAIVEGKKQTLAANTLLLIEKGERHEIKNTGRTPLKTINFYSPPQYQ